MNGAFKSHRGLTFYVIAIVGTFFLMAWLVSFVRKYTLPPPLNAARAVERSKALAELEAANANALSNYGWVDHAKGMVQLPMNVAVPLTVQEWQQPAAGRAKLLRLATKFAGTQTNAPASGGPPASAGTGTNAAGTAPTPAQPKAPGGSPTNAPGGGQ